MDTASLLEALASGPCSGEDLAARSGVSRAMIWKTMESLRAEGLEIEGSRAGYRLVDARHAFGPATLAWRCRRPVAFHDQCGSTNALAKRAARDWPGPPVPGPVVVANHQTGGRGRRGRSWESPAGANLLFSVVLRPQVAPPEAARCVLQWAAAMAAATGLKVKWPNDLVTDDGQKVAGLLAELDVAAEPFGSGASVRSLVLGVGVNANQKEFPAHLPAATSLATLQGGPVDRAELLARLLAAIASVDVHAADPLAQWRAVSHTLGRRVRIGDTEGTAGSIREDGALLVDGQPVLTGDVELLAR